MRLNLNLNHPRLRLLLFGLLVVTLYWPGLNGGFYFDDTHVLNENPDIQLEKLDWAGLSSAAQSFGPGGRELSMVTFALNHYFFGDTAWAFKLVNLLLHLLNGWLLLRITALVLEIGLSRRRIPPLLPWQKNLLVTAPAALWLLQPINLVPVLYISQRMALLAALFMLLGIYLFLDLRRRQTGLSLDHGGDRRSVGYTVAILLGTLLLTGLAWLSKENGILLPAYIAWLEWVLFRTGRRPGGGQSSGGLVLLGVSLLVLALLLIFPHWVEPWFGDYAGRSFDLEQRLLTQFRGLSFYLSQTIVPNISELSMWHDDVPVSTSLWTPPSTLAAFGLVLALFCLGILSAARYPLIAVGLGWFFISHALESSLWPLELVHEHRHYLASFGVGLALLYLLVRVMQSRRRLLFYLLLGWFALHAYGLGARAAIWSNPLIKSSHEARHHPDSPIALMLLASHYYRLVELENPSALQRVTQLLERARPLARHNIAGEVMSILTSRFDGVSLEPHWVEAAAVKLLANRHSSYNFLAVRNLLFCLRKPACAEGVSAAEVAPLFDAAADTDIERLLNLAALYYAEVRLDLDTAKGYFLRAEQRSGERPYYLLNTARLFLVQGDLEPACTRYARLLQDIDSQRKSLRDDIDKLGADLQGKCADTTPP